jgi:hypothetical protein
MSPRVLATEFDEAPRRSAQAVVELKEDSEEGCKSGKSADETLKHECEAETAEKCLFQEIIATLKRRVEVFEYFRNLCMLICARMNACKNFFI